MRCGSDENCSLYLVMCSRDDIGPGASKLYYYLLCGGLKYKTVFHSSDIYTLFMCAEWKMSRKFFPIIEPGCCACPALTVHMQQTREQSVSGEPKAVRPWQCARMSEQIAREEIHLPLFGNHLRATEKKRLPQVRFVPRAVLR